MFGLERLLAAEEGRLIFGEEGGLIQAGQINGHHF